LLGGGNEPTFSVFLDESGDPGWVAPRGRSRTNHFVIGGVALLPAQEIALETSLPRLIRNAFRLAGFSDSPELKCNDLIRRRGHYRKLSLQAAKELEDKVFDLLLETKPLVFGTALAKDRHQTRYVTPFPPKRVALSATVSRLNMTMRRLGAYARLSMDEEHAKRDAALREMIHDGRTGGLVYRGASYNPPVLGTPDRILGALVFTPSHMSVGVQFADFCAGIIWRYFERGEVDRFNQIEPLMDRDQFRRYEPCLIPNPG
jgi:hypothetical protein